MPTVPPKPVPGEGTVFQISISGTMTTVGNVTEVNGVATSIEPVDTSWLGSTVHTARPSQLPKPEEMTLIFWFNPADASAQAIFWNDVNSPGTIEDFQITFNDGTTTPSKATFSGFVTKFELTGIKIEENIGAEVTIQLVTVVTYIAGTLLARGEPPDFSQGVGMAQARAANKGAA
jgi:hypothetical protein